MKRADNQQGNAGLGRTLSEGWGFVFAVFQAVAF
jgi:hypothetical protein